MKQNDNDTAKQFLNNGQNIAAQTQCDKTTELCCRIEERDIIRDLKFTLKEFFVASFSGDEQLIIAFNNGQRFELSVKETALPYACV